MFRRIQLINEARAPDGEFLSLITGLMGPQRAAVFDAWAHELDTPRKYTGKNVRFYFTEAGWDRFGRAVVAACQRSAQRYRVLKVKERAVEVIYRDAWQVAVRPRQRDSSRRRG